jgi:uncharacterized DUF497 family protein
MITIRRLLWDPGNVAHIARHGVTIEDVEAACHSNPVVQQGYGGRLLIFGPARDGRLLTVVLEPESEEGAYDVITARPASRRERRVYRERREEGGET